MALLEQRDPRALFLRALPLLQQDDGLWDRLAPLSDKLTDEVVIELEDKFEAFFANGSNVKNRAALLFLFFQSPGLRAKHESWLLYGLRLLESEHDSIVTAFVGDILDLFPKEAVASALSPWQGIIAAGPFFNMVAPFLGRSFLSSLLELTQSNDPEDLAVLFELFRRWHEQGLIEDHDREIILHHLRAVASRIRKIHEAGENLLADDLVGQSEALCGQIEGRSC